MSLVDRGAVQAPAPMAVETAAAPEPLQGDVEVRGLMLNERLRIQALAWQSGGRIDISELLAASVFASDGMPLWSKAEWDACRDHAGAMRLFSVAARLSGFISEDVEKK